MSVSLRVHIAPVGFQFRRVTEPLIKMRADKVYFVTLKKDDAAKKFLSKIETELRTSYPHIRVEYVYLDIWDPYQCVEKFREIILKEVGNQVFINVSTGTKITAIAGMLASMLWGAIPYYARVSSPLAKEPEILATEYVEDPEILPVYEINKPKPEWMLVLSMIKANGGKIRKARLIKKLEEEGIIKIRDESKIELSEAAKHSQLRAILDPMEKVLKYVSVEASGRRSEVSITEQGKTALRIFGVNDS